MYVSNSCTIGLMYIFYRLCLLTSGIIIVSSNCLYQFLSTCTTPQIQYVNTFARANARSLYQNMQYCRNYINMLSRENALWSNQNICKLVIKS